MQVRGGREQDSSGQICLGRERETGETNTAPCTPPTSKSLLFQMSGQLDIRPACVFSLSGSPAPHGLIRCPSNLGCQTSMHCSLFMGNIRDAVTAGREGGGPFLFLRCVTERQTDWHLEKYTVGTQQRLCSHDYDLSPQVSVRLIRTDQSLFSHSSEGRVNRLYPTCPLLGEQGLQFMAVLWGC